MNRALLIVDYSNDFVADEGSLSCGKPAQALDEQIVEQIELALKNDDFIFICNDEHIEDSPYNPESMLFPAHNIAGTWGAEIYGQTGKLVKKLLSEGREKVRYIPKLRYSAFFGTPLNMMLRFRDVDHLTVVGICTDICVLHTVIEATYAGYIVTVPEKCCSTFTKHGQEWAIEHMRDCLSVEII